jgi:hypothetical protein
MGLEIAVAGKPDCYGSAVLHKSRAQPNALVAVRLAGDSALKIAIAGEPDCYGSSAPVEAFHPFFDTTTHKPLARSILWYTIRPNTNPH